MRRGVASISPMFPRGLPTWRGGFNLLGIPTGPDPGDFPQVQVRYAQRLKGRAQRRQDEAERTRMKGQG